MIRAACHCGAVRFEIAEPPEWVLDCNCTLCRRYGALWSYYHPPDHAKLLLKPDPAATEIYLWADRALAFHRCKICGCATHFAVAADGSAEREQWLANLPAEFAVLQPHLRDLLSRAAGAETSDFLGTLPKFG